MALNVQLWPRWPAICLPIGNENQAKLMDDVEVTIWDDAIERVFVIPKGFLTDGASIPRALWRLCGHPLQSPRVYAALVHDYLYSGFLKGITRELADKVYRAILLERDVSRVKVSIEYAALRLFGGSHFVEFSDKKKGEENEKEND